MEGQGSREKARKAPELVEAWSMIEGRGSGTGKLIRAENFDSVARAGGKLTRWRCSEYSAGTSRLIIEVDNRNTNRLGQPGVQNSDTVNTDELREIF